MVESLHRQRLTPYAWFREFYRIPNSEFRILGLFNRCSARLFDESVAQHFFGYASLLAWLRGLVNDERFSVDGALLETWASHRSLRPTGALDPGAVECVHAQLSDVVARPALLRWFFERPTVAYNFPLVSIMLFQTPR